LACQALIAEAAAKIAGGAKKRMIQGYKTLLT
jgi:hypothetical protein